MQLEYYYWCFKGAIPSRICDDIVSYGNELKQQAKIKGTVTVFPSFVWHRVKPVTSGTRYSLVNWHQGRPFV
jgi:predicted 2-oxoglutarate/Fe(II)-dependent dioxygenase YbiX